MSLKTQLQKLKENWLIVAILVLLLVFFSPAWDAVQQALPSYGVAERGVGGIQTAEAKRGVPSPIWDGGSFAPEVKDRKITKTASLSTEVERGTFKDAESQLKGIVTAADAFLLNENVQKYGTDRRSYYSGNYFIKVEASKYGAVTSQLQQIGDVQSFQESTEDITEQLTNTRIELDGEKERLRRYQQMFADTATVSEKIELSDRIFDQERRVKYLEDQLEHGETRVEYSTLFVTITEKQSAYAEVVFVTFSELVAKLVASITGVLELLMTVLPYALIAGVVWLVVRKIRKKK